MQEYDEVIKKIAAWLKETKIPKKALAAKVSKSGGWVSNFIHQKRQLSLKDFLAICKALNIDPGVFISDEKEDREKLSLSDYCQKILQTGLRDMIRLEIKEELKQHKKEK